jgi:Zn-dependent protease with chaperone function
MDMRGLTGRLCALVRFRAVFLLSIVAIFSIHLWAQPADDDDDEESDVSFARLAIRYDARGKADVTFYLFGDIQNWGTIQAELEQALHCPAGSLVNPPPNPTLPKYLKSRTAKEQAQYEKYAEQWRKSTLQGECSAAMTRKGLLLSTDIPLGSLMAELKRGGAQKLSVRVTYPKSKFSEQTPGTNQPWDADSQDRPHPVTTELYSNANYLLDVGVASSKEIHLAFGLRMRDAIRAAILPAVFLLSPILICLWMRRAAIRDAKTDPTGAWFSYFRVLMWCGNCLLLIWMLGHTIRQGLEVLASYYTAGSNGGAVAISVGILMLPPWIAFFICILLSYEVYVHVRGNTWTRGEFIANQFLAIASQLLPLMCFLAAMGMISVNGQVSMALFIGAYATYTTCRWLTVKVSGTCLEPLTTGELRDHVFELAKKAAVEVRQVFVMPSGKSQMANAFASRNHLVFFTDYLLNRLNKREVSAVAAHEITHIQKKHSTWKIAALVALLLSPQILSGILIAFVGSLRHSLQLRQATEGADSASGLASVVHFFDQVLAFPELILILYTFALVLYFLQSQYLEHVADTGAVQLTGDPEAVITSLLKLGRLNLSPVQWDQATGSLLTHPSTLKRVQRVARIGQVSPERFEHLLMDSMHRGPQPRADEGFESKEQFSGATLQNPVVTPISYSEELAFKKGVLRFLYIMPPALVVWTVVHYHVQHAIAAYILGGIASLVLHMFVAEWQETWGRNRLKRKFRARLEADGIAANDRNAELIALSPHAAPRVYALGYTWDKGYLFFAKDRLCYAGDQVRFALKPEQVLAVRFGPGLPGWFTEPRIAIDWQLDTMAPVQTWNMLPKEPCSLWHINRQFLDLHTKIERWKSQPAEFPDAPPCLSDLSAPAIGEVTSQALKSVVTFGRFVKVALFNQILAIAVCLTLEVPSLWYVCSMNLLALVYTFMPFWFYKDPEQAMQGTSAATGRYHRDAETF